jgi:hypothetical protein
MLLYDKEQALQPQDRHIFRTTREEWPNKSLSQMRQWLLISNPFVSYCLKMNKKQTKNGHQVIRQFFSRGKHTRIPTWYKSTRKCKKASRTKMQTNLITQFYQPIKNHNKNSIQQPFTNSSNQTEYYSSQGRPPDQSTRQTSIQNFFQPH